MEKVELSESLTVETLSYRPQWGPWGRQMVTLGLIIAAVFGLILLLPVIQVLVATFLLAFLLYIPSRFVARRTPLNFKGGVAIVYLIIILLIILTLVAVIPLLVEGVRNLTVGLQLQYEGLRTWLTEYEAGDAVIVVLGRDIDLDSFVQQIRPLIIGTGPVSLPPSAGGGLPLNLGEAVAFITNTISDLLSGITNLFSTGFLALFLSFLILLDLPNYQHQVVRGISPAYRRELFLLIDKIIGVWNGFFRGQLLIGVIIGLLTWIQLRLMGVRQPELLALITAFISLIPTIGGIIALVPLSLVPLINGSTVFPDIPNATFALLVVAVNLVVSQIIWNVVAPKIMGDAISLPLPAIIIGIVIGTAIGGVLGAFLIVPILGTIRVVVLYLLNKINQRDPYPGEALPVVESLSTM